MQLLAAWLTLAGMIAETEPGWLVGLRAALREVKIRSMQPGPAAARIAQDWTKSYRAMLAKVSSESLIAVYLHTGGKVGDPEADALAAEIERRNLEL